MSSTNDYITPDELLSNVAVMCGDKAFEKLPYGLYISLMKDAFDELSMDTFFQEKRVDLDFPTENLTLSLPDDCFNIRNVYIFNGDICGVNNSKKLWWKRNYYTTGNGYIANDKGNNFNDPFLQNRSLSPNRIEDKSFIRYDERNRVNDILFYNTQMGNIMFSSSCRGQGTKIHIHYNATAGEITNAPIIPRYFKTALQDYIIVSALKIRMANETSNIRNLQPLLNTYITSLDKEGMYGSWFSAIMRVRNMDSSKKAELSEYLSRGAWATGL